MIILLCCSRLELLYGVYSMGLYWPIEIQNEVLPVLLTDPPMNVVVQSSSRTGKSIALALSMLSRVDVSKKWPQVKSKGLQ